MAATGFFVSPLAGTLLTRPKVIYTQPSTPPTSGGNVPISRAPATSPPINRFPTSTPTTTTTTRPSVPTTVNPSPTVPDTSSPAAPAPSSTGGGGTAGAGAGTGGPFPGGGTDSRLLDLLASAFQSQDISQPYGPIASGPTEVASSSSGPNPIALLVLGIIAVAGVMWYMKRQKRNAA